jgi:hypothetical protein
VNVAVNVAVSYEALADTTFPFGSVSEKAPESVAGSIDREKVAVGVRSREMYTEPSAGVRPVTDAAARPDVTPKLQLYAVPSVPPSVEATEPSRRAV